MAAIRRRVVHTAPSKGKELAITAPPTVKLLNDGTSRDGEECGRLQYTEIIETTTTTISAKNYVITDVYMHVNLVV